MRCTLELRSPSNGTGWGERWSFSGPDDLLLRDCLRQLDAFTTEPPLEVWDEHRRRRVVREGDRWRAAMLLWPEELSGIGTASVKADDAWTEEGARRLADLLPERLRDLGDAIRARFPAS